MAMPSPELQDLVNRIRMEYLEMPGLALTSGQAQRMWNLDLGLCDAVLSTLVREEFLSQASNGAFLRRGGGGRRGSAAASSGADSLI
jgi:hypothetical protein